MVNAVLHISFCQKMERDVYVNINVRYLFNQLFISPFVPHFLFPDHFSELIPALDPDHDHFHLISVLS